jgi:hypothetical protein
VGRIRINPPAKKLNPQLYTRVIPAELQETRGRYGALGGTFQPQYRVGAPHMEPDTAPQPDYFVPWDTAHQFPLSKAEYDQAMKRKAERQQAEARAEHRRLNEIAEAERVRLAHAAEDERRRLALIEEAERKATERRRESDRLETSLIQAEIDSAMVGMSATPDEVKEVYGRVFAQGLQLLPEMWTAELERLRAERI